MMALDTQKELQTVKKTLKAWETEFIKQHNHRPDKDDVGQAPQHIQGSKFPFNIEWKYNCSKTADIPSIWY